MNFPNAANGVKKIFTSQILEIVSAVAIFIGALMALIMLVSASNANEGATIGFGAGTLVFGLGGIIVSLVASILYIVGIVKAGRDDHNFKTALTFVIFGIGVSIVGSFFQSTNTTVYGICTTIEKITDLCATCYVIQGIISLAEQLGNSVIANKGKTLLKVIFAVYAVAIIGVISYTLILINPALAVIGYVILCISLIISIVSYFLFLSLLAKAKNMFN